MRYTKEEKQIISNVQQGKYVSVSNLEHEKERLVIAAKNNNKKDREIELTSNQK